MASADYSIGTKVTADVSNFEKGMNKAEKSLKGFSDKLANSIDRLGKKGLIGSVANVTLAMQGLTKSFGTVIKFAKDVGKAINECTEAYKGQVIAERALDTAIQNNPFISGESSKALKQFASDMQKVTNYGDDELIPMMTNLVSLGRTESEVMQIMSVAMDMSAGMGISLDTAITQLNATLNGNIGRLGQQNAELKGLTEEELKQGKAIEILGEKFKGLSSATADTSKQLQNIKGDFKEALGQFTLPSSDLWNKFWAGFYERGIEVIGKINAYIDAQTIGRKLASEYVKQIKAISTEKVYNPETGIYDVRDLGARVKYIREALKVLSDEELEALNNYLSSQRRLNDEEQQLLNRIKAEQDSRYQSSVNAKKEAEDKKKQADAEAQVTAELQKQAEVAKKKTDWNSKLLDQQIELLENERDLAIQNAEAMGEETFTIWKDYNEKILELRLERLEKEKQEALKEEGLTAEDKIKIEEYYENETKKIYADLGNYKKKKNAEEKKDEKNKFAVIVEYAKQYAGNVAKVISKITSTIKNVFSAVGNMFNGALNIFNFNPDDALVSLLKIEDSILTFFVETLPKLPSFFASAIQSIVVLLDNLLSNIDWASIQKMLNAIIDIIINNAPSIASKVLKAVINIAQTLLNGLMHFLKSGGWKILMDFLLELQQTIEEFVIDNIDELADTIADMMPALVVMLVKSIVSASKTLGKIIKPVLKIIGTLIEAILKVITSSEVINASINAISQVVEAIVSFIIGNIVPILINITSAIIQNLPQILPSLITAIVSGISNGVSTGFVNSFKNVKWGDLLKGFGDVLKSIAEDFLGIITGGVSKVVTGSGKGKGSTGERVIKGLLTGGLSEIFGWASGTNNAPAGLSIVGEAGPELVKFRGGEQVLNNRNTNKALADIGGKTNNFNVTFNNLQDTSAFTMMNQLKQYNRQMAINGVI